MIKKLLFLLSLLLLLSCGGIDLVLKEKNDPSPFINKTSVVFDGIKKEEFVKELISSFGNTSNAEYILVTSFVENKENRLVKENQVAEKIDYEIAIDYKIFYKSMDCNIYNNKIVTKFSFVPKSFGYNFGADRSLEKLYKSSIRDNIQNFIKLAPKKNKQTCL